MEFKLYNFLILYYLVFAAGSFIPEILQNRICSPLRRSVQTDGFSLDLQNNYDQRNTIQEEEESISTMDTTSIEEETERNTARQCPEGQSSIYEKDLNDMIIFLAVANNLIESINGSYFEFATSVRDKHLKTIHDFLTRIQDRSTHLSHILDDMVQIRKEQIEPLVKELSNKLPEINSLKTKYTEHMNTSKILLDKFQKSNKICALNCDDTEFRLRNKRSTSENSYSFLPFSSIPSLEIYYCSTLKDVKNRINVVLSKFRNEHIKTLHNTLDNIDSNYDIDIEILKSKVKEAAVQAFSTTMYDVLSLEDEYYHFLNSLRGEAGINVLESQVNKIRKNIMEANLKTEEFKNNVEKYRKYCLSCDGKKERRYDRYLFDTTGSRQQRYRQEPNYDELLTDATHDVTPPEQPDDLLELLLNNYIHNIEIEFQNDQDTLFEKINVVFTDKDRIIQQALADLHPLQNEIIIDLKTEERELNALKNQVPESLLEDLKNLNDDLTSSQTKLEEALKFMQQAFNI